MSVVTSDRTALDKALADGDLVIVLLFGASGGQAQEIHDFAAANISKPWWTQFILRDSVTLTSQERKAWGTQAESYVALTKSRKVSSSGSVASLFNQDGTASIAKVRKVFASAGAAP